MEWTVDYENNINKIIFQFLITFGQSMQLRHQFIYLFCTTYTCKSQLIKVDKNSSRAESLSLNVYPHSLGRQAPPGYEQLIWEIQIQESLSDHVSIISKFHYQLFCFKRKYSLVCSSFVLFFKADFSALFLLVRTFNK